MDARRSLNLVVRTATPADASLLADLGARTFRDTFAADNRPEDMDAFLASHYSPDHQARELRDPQHLFLIAQDAETAAGFALLGAGPGAPEVAGHRPVRLERLYVDRPYLGAGVGKVLMRRCLDEARARGHDVLWLGVWENNHRALAFYARWGFREVGEETFVLGSDVQRDVLLVLPLEPA
jgi:ribosomal protein S18 acetylase RimI-like enzyme